TGFDPAHDGARAPALPDGVVVHARPFGHADAALRPDLVCGRHVLEHVADPRAFLTAVRGLAAGRPEAVVFFEVPNARHMLAQRAIWGIVYEPCLYVSAASLDGVFRPPGLPPLARPQPLPPPF